MDSTVQKPCPGFLGDLVVNSGNPVGRSLGTWVEASADTAGGKPRLLLAPGRAFVAVSRAGKWGEPGVGGLPWGDRVWCPWPSLGRELCT